jgi:hypothetical protein
MGAKLNDRALAPVGEVLAMMAPLEQV